MKKAIQVLALLVVGATGVQAQHDMTPANLIDGSKRPSEIPMTLALRLWLNSETHGPVTVRKEIGLSPEDAAALKPIMEAHRKQLDALTQKRENDGNRDQFWYAYNQRAADDLTKIQDSLSREGVFKFMAFLESKKAGMLVSAYDDGLGAVAKRNLAEAQMVASMSGVPQGTGMTPNYSAFNNATVYNAIDSVDIFGTNGSLNSTNWVTRYGSFSIFNQNVSVTGGGGASGLTALAYYANGNQQSWEQCSLTIVGTVPGSNQMGSAINISPTAENFYFVDMVPSGYYLYKMASGTSVWLGTYAHTPVSGDELNLCNDGAGNLTVQLNANSTPILSAHDTSYTAGYPGIQGNSTGTQHNASLTLFAAYSSMASIGMKASVTGDTICGYSGFCTGKIHTPHVKNYNALRGSTVNGPGVSPDTYIDTYNNVVYPRSDFTPNDWVVMVSEEVDCSSAGTFFIVTPPTDPPPFWEQRELGMSMWRNTKAPNGTFYNQYCSPRTSSSDIDLGFAPIAGDILEPALTVTGVAERLGGVGWRFPWLSVGEGFTLAVLPPRPVDCTNWDNGWITQIKGGRILKNTGGPQPANPPVQ